ncbi:hypothetical protein ACF1GY_37090 [Streptomyces sp. NPDC014684]|uniref:hypothetical protein n=1 Tax=Streptomyces sp. NPDC014684 TaxID=3364880 RepID=UPI0036F9E0C3
MPAALFLPGVAYLGITNGHQFIANGFFAFMYCLACVGFASVPLMAWRRGGGRYADPGYVRSAWFPWLFTTGQGVAYSSARGDTNVFVLIVGWGVFIYAGMIALYFLARALWAVDDDPHHHPAALTDARMAGRQGASARARELPRRG